MRVIAHRTCPLEAPENSLSGIRTAAARGADMVECDVRVTRDGTVVLSHDPHLMRTALRPLVVRWTTSERFATIRHRFSRELMVTLDAAFEVLGWLPELWIAIELKDPAALDRIADEPRWPAMRGRAEIWSNDPTTVEAASGVIRTTLLRTLPNDGAVTGYLADAVECGATAVSVDEPIVTASMVARGHEAGLEVVSLVRSPSTLLRVALMGVDGLVTDWPAEARAVVERVCGREPDR